MGFLNDRVRDEGLSVLSAEADRLDICSAAPASFADATGRLSLGVKVRPAIGQPSALAQGGRKVTVEHVSDGTMTGNGVAPHWALSDTAGGRLLAAGLLAAPLKTTRGNIFKTDAFDIGIPGVV